MILLEPRAILKCLIIKSAFAFLLIQNEKNKFCISLYLTSYKDYVKKGKTALCKNVLGQRKNEEFFLGMFRGK